MASEVETTTAALIAKKDSVQGVFRNAVAQGLQVIINHAKAAGDAVVKDCPVRTFIPFEISSMKFN